jgi:hypothetical protein
MGACDMKQYKEYCLHCGSDTRIMRLPVRSIKYDGKFCDMICLSQRQEKDKQKEAIK